MTRYAVYYTPAPGPLADFTAGWLGWDAARGIAAPRLAVDGLPIDAEAITKAARKYGFHGTIKAPFRLQSGCTENALKVACAELAASLAPICLDGMMLQSIGGFLALVPKGNTAAMHHLAEQIVLGLEVCRAPLTDGEIAKRRPETLTPRQRELLASYGYPFVRDEFQFHLTLTGALHEADLAATIAALAPHLVPLVPNPFWINDLSLCAEGDDGLFRILHRYALTG